MTGGERFPAPHNRGDVRTWRLEELDPPEATPAPIVDPMERVALVLVGVILVAAGALGVADRFAARPVAGDAEPVAPASAAPRTFLLHSDGRLWCRADVVSLDMNVDAQHRRIYVVTSSPPSVEPRCVLTTARPAPTPR